jgi:hypothetical protein
MGVERILQAAPRLAVLAASGVALCATPALAAPRTHERAAVIDLGPGDAAVRRKLAVSIVAAGLDPVIGDGVEDALAGQSVDPDATQLAAAIGEAQRAFGVLDCKAAVTASKTAVGIAAARQAAHLPVPELPRAWTYLLLCADRTGDVDAAMHAAARLRTAGGSADVPRDVWAKYPAVDTTLDRDMIPLDIKAEVAGAEIWIDFERAGVSPLHVLVPAGEHVIAAASGGRRGWASGTAVKTQAQLVIPMTEQTGPWTQVARRVASWNGKLPPPGELAWVLERVKARIAVVRHGDTIEAWGRIGPSEPPRRLGGDDGTGPVADIDRVLALVVDRLHTWNDRAPDPDRPLILEDARDPVTRKAKDDPTKWWVYATILGAVGAAAAFVYVHDAASDTQHVELHYP